MAENFVHSQRDLRNRLTPAILDFQEEMGYLPRFDIGHDSVNAKCGSSASAYHIPTFSIWTNANDVGRFGLLTTPISFLEEIPKDPFSPVDSPGAFYGYYTIGSAGVLFGAGPNRSYEINPDLIESEGKLDMDYLMGIRYDPTNGLASSGDIIYPIYEILAHGQQARK